MSKTSHLLIIATFLTAAVSLATPHVSFAQTATTAPAKPIDEAHVNELLKQLSSDDGDKRRAAVDALVAMGAPVVPYIQKFAAGDIDARTKSRAQAVIDRVNASATPNQMSAPSAWLPGVRVARPVPADTTPGPEPVIMQATANVGSIPITLDLQEVDAREAFDTLFSQAKGSYRTFPQDLLKGSDIPPVTVSVTNGSFWKVFLDLSKQTGVSMQPYGGDRFTLSKNNDDFMKYPMVVSGPFLIMLQSINYNRSVNYAHPENRGEGLSLQFMAYAEPATKIARSYYNINLDEAVDDKGNNIVVRNNFGDGYQSGRQSYYNFTASIDPKTTGKTITKLKGKAKFGIEGEAVRIEAQDLYNVKNLVKQAGQTTVTITSISKPAAGNEAGGNYTVNVKIGITRNNRGRMDVSPNGLKLLDADGKELSQNGWGGSGGQDGYTYNINYNRMSRNGDGQTGEPAKLVWDVPTKIVDIEVPFEFKDLPLP